MTDVVLGTSGRWLGIRTRAGGAANPSIKFFFFAAVHNFMKIKIFAILLLISVPFDLISFLYQMECFGIISQTRNGYSVI